MTIDVTVKREDEGNGNSLHVAVVERDIYGNPTTDVRDIMSLAAGESVTVGIHDMKDLRVYETELSLPSEV